MNADWIKKPQTLAVAGIVLVVIIALVVILAVGGSSSGDSSGPANSSGTVATKSDVRVVVSGTDGSGTVVAKTVKPGVAVAIHRAKPGQPKVPGDKLNVGTTDKKGAFELFSWQPGEYVLVGPNGEKKAFAITATQRAVVVPFAVCVSGCAKVAP